METTFDNVDSGINDDESESQLNCVVVEPLPHYRQSGEPGLFLRHASSLTNTQISTKDQQSNIDTNIPGPLNLSDKNPPLPVQIQESNLRISSSTILPSNCHGEDVKMSNINVTSPASNEAKDVGILADKPSSKEIIVLRQYPSFSGTAYSSANAPDICSNDRKDIQRSFLPLEDNLNDLKVGLKHASGSMPLTVSSGTNLASNQLVGKDKCRIRKGNCVEESIENNGKKCGEVINSDEIGMDIGDVSEEVTVDTYNEHICIKVECTYYTCGFCELKFVTLCKLHDHFENQHSTGSYIYFQSTKIGFPRLDNVSKLTQTDFTDLAEMGQTGFKNDEVCDIDNNNDYVDSEFDCLPSENIEKMDDTTKIGVNDTDNFEAVKVFKSNNRKKKVKQKNKKKGGDLKEDSKSEGNPSLKIYVSQKKLKTSKKQKAVTPNQKSSNDVDKVLENSNNNGVYIDMDYDEENNESQSDLAFPDNDKDNTEIRDDSDVNIFENFTSIANRKFTGARSKAKVLPSQLKRKQNQIQRVKESSKEVHVTDEDKNSGSYKCNICATKYDSKVKLQYHLTKVHKKANGDTEKQCRWCGLTFSGSKSHMSHMRQCEKNEYLTCLICNIRFATRNEVTDHLITHRNESDLKCKICSRMFSSAVTLHGHLRRHNLRKDIQCELCGKAFYYHNLLKKHKLYCNQEAEVECPHCAVKFKTQDALKHHLSVHSNDRPYVCHVCGYAAKKSMYLKRHLRRHTGERPYVCSDCGMRFAAGNGLNRHKKIHNNDKPCICPFCDKSFTNNWNLKTHLRQHTGDTPYQCRQCDKAFKQNVLLKLHMKSHHSAGNVIA